MVAELTVAGGALARLVRRSLQAAPKNFEHLHYHAGSYERSAPEMQVNPKELLPVLITVIIFLLAMASIRYTVGDVMASLAMIESPSSTAIIEPSPPKYSEEPEYPDEKETSKLLSPDADVEITIINHKKISSKIRAMSGRLYQVGGVVGRWRGLGWSFAYHTAHNLISHSLSTIFGLSWIGEVLFYLLTSLMLARLHMRWTHAMIAKSATGPSTRQTFDKKHAGLALVIPTIVFALAQQATIMLPLAMAINMSDVGAKVHGAAKSPHSCAGEMTAQVLRGLSVLVIMIVCAVSFLLPASITLTRIEAALLPADKEAIVPFDHEAILGVADISTRQGRKALFKQAWKSVDRTARLHVFKVYLKMVFIQAALAIIAVHVITAEALLVGREKIAILLESARAQIKLAMMEAQKQA